MQTALSFAWKFLFGWLASNQGTVRRLIVTVLGALAVLLHQKFGVAIDPAHIDAFAAIVVAFILGSNVKEALVTAKKPEPAKAITTLDEAVTELSKPTGVK